MFYFTIINTLLFSSLFLVINKYIIYNNNKNTNTNTNTNTKTNNYSNNIDNNKNNLIENFKSSKKGFTLEEKMKIIDVSVWDENW